EVDPQGRKGLLDLRLRLYNPLGVDQARVEAVLIDPKGKKVREHSAVLRLGDQEVQLWPTALKNHALCPPDTPSLYSRQVSVTAQGGVHQWDQQIGFRHFEFQKKGPFFLNGERLLLRGTHRHEDHAGVGSGMTEAQIIQEMERMK